MTAKITKKTSTPARKDALGNLPADVFNAQSSTPHIPVRKRNPAAARWIQSKLQLRRYF